MHVCAGVCMRVHVRACVCMSAQAGPCARAGACAECVCEHAHACTSTRANAHAHAVCAHVPYRVHTCVPACPRAPAAPRHRWVPPAPRCQRGLASPWGGGGSAVRASSCLLPWKPSAPRAREPRGHAGAGGGVAGGAGLLQAARALARAQLRGDTAAPWGWSWLHGDTTAPWGQSRLSGGGHGSAGMAVAPWGTATGPWGQSWLHGMVTTPPGWSPVRGDAQSSTGTVTAPQGCHGSLASAMGTAPIPVSLPSPCPSCPCVPPVPMSLPSLCPSRGLGGDWDLWWVPGQESGMGTHGCRDTWCPSPPAGTPKDPPGPRRPRQGWGAHRYLGGGPWGTVTPKLRTFVTRNPQCLQQLCNAFGSGTKKPLPAPFPVSRPHLCPPLLSPPPPASAGGTSAR